MSWNSTIECPLSVFCGLDAEEVPASNDSKKRRGRDDSDSDSERASKKSRDSSPPSQFPETSQCMSDFHAGDGDSVLSRGGRGKLPIKSAASVCNFVRSRKSQSEDIGIPANCGPTLF